MKTLATLNFRENEISDEGIQQLVNALEHNKVRLELLSSIAYTSV
jgi:hypothetical protein